MGLGKMLLEGAASLGEGMASMFDFSGNFNRSNILTSQQLKYLQQNFTSEQIRQRILNKNFPTHIEMAWYEMGQDLYKAMSDFEKGTGIKLKYKT